VRMLTKSYRIRLKSVSMGNGAIIPSGSSRMIMVRGKTWIVVLGCSIRSHEASHSLVSGVTRGSQRMMIPGRLEWEPDFAPLIELIAEDTRPGWSWPKIGLRESHLSRWPAPHLHSLATMLNLRPQIKQVTMVPCLQ
jgi:hypothetical protein